MSASGVSSCEKSFPKSCGSAARQNVGNVAAVVEAGIAAVVDLAVELSMPAFPRGMTYCRFPITDGQPDSPVVLRAAIETVAALLRARLPTLVCCGAGMSRSPAVAAGALFILRGGNPDDHLRSIALGHPHDISPQLWQAVRLICREVQRTMLR